MAVFISLLRGVNLGPLRKIKMTELKTLYQSLGFTKVQTLLQSGNVVFETEQTDLLEIARQIEEGIQKTFGFHSQIILRTPDQLRAVIAGHQFTASPGNSKKGKFYSKPDGVESERIYKAIAL